jgi:hypothetical protein
MFDYNNFSNACMIVIIPLRPSSNIYQAGCFFAFACFFFTGDWVADRSRLSSLKPLLSSPLLRRIFTFGIPLDDDNKLPITANDDDDDDDDDAYDCSSLS